MPSRAPGLNRLRGLCFGEGFEFAAGACCTKSLAAAESTVGCFSSGVSDGEASGSIACHCPITRELVLPA
ncbi:MAG: hypothetical protein AMJ38_03695 [Dehalococcoidia bacterium DG_22]|nr:MAG: hypothetical protein AMJ38_03695 [Dehalococcoidia bacterium DG_22]